MSKTTQEFYCNDCDGYIRVRINDQLIGRVAVVCPKCGREHGRNYSRGRIVQQTYYEAAGKLVERLLPTMAAYSKQAIKIKRHARESEEVKPDLAGQSFLNSLWKNTRGN